MPFDSTEPSKKPTRTARWRARLATEGIGQINITAPHAMRADLHAIAHHLCSGKTLADAVATLGHAPPSAADSPPQQDPRIAAAEQDARIAWAALRAAREDADALRRQLSVVTAERDQLLTERAQFAVSVLEDLRSPTTSVIRDGRHG